MKSKRFALLLHFNYPPEQRLGKHELGLSKQGMLNVKLSRTFITQTAHFQLCVSDISPFPLVNKIKVVLHNPAGIQVDST
jgi:hypothetical protein